MHIHFLSANECLESDCSSFLHVQRSHEPTHRVSSSQVKILFSFFNCNLVTTYDDANHSSTPDFRDFESLGDEFSLRVNHLDRIVKLSSENSVRGQRPLPRTMVPFAFIG